MLNNLFLPLLVVCRCKIMSHSIENLKIFQNIFLAIMSLGLETEDQVKSESDKLVSNN